MSATVTDLFCGAGGSSTGMTDAALINPTTNTPRTITNDDVNACRFRMLEPHEIARGMAFPHDYVMLGTKRERVKQAGNAVTPPAARDIALVVAETLEAAA